jgi:hypothetical protein
MRKIISRVVVPVLSLGLLVGAVATAGAASASGPQQFNTHINQNPDTTNVGGGATISSPFGPVWAYDNITIKLTPVPVSGLSDGANYRVTEDVVGSFHGFADPTTAAALTSDGSVKGTIYYDVLATQGPDGAGLAPTYPGASAPSLSQLAVNLFDDNATVVGGGDVYSFSYQNGNYTQVATPTLTVNGDVVGH